MKNSGHKAALRREMRRHRRALDERERLSAAASVLGHLQRSRHWQRARRIGCYLANDGEVSLEQVIRHALDTGREVYLPVLADVPPGRLRFCAYARDTPMKKNRFGISEPDVSASGDINPAFLDLVLAPLVAFDADGRRLGMGGGFYDRTFAYLHERRHWRQPPLIGVAYAFQQTHDVPSDSWDVPLSGIVTDRGMFTPATG